MFENTKSGAIIALNWKMFLSPKQEVAFCEQNKSALVTIATNHTLVIFPSFLTLHTLMHVFAETPVNLGGQDCSEHEYGPYTGQVSAQALAELGCTYVLLGHAELGNTDEMVRKKTERALEAGLTPIVCTDKPIQTTANVVYEPKGSIGTGVTPTPEEIERALSAIQTPGLKLYGGSVSSKNAAQLAQIPSLDGVLIGRASLDIQELSKIVNSLSK